MLRLWFLVIFLFCLDSGFSQNQTSYEKLLKNGESQISDYHKDFEKVLYPLKLEEEEVIAVYFNVDSTRLMIITERFSSYDPTNDIRSDDHNKVNFITSDAFNNKNVSPHYYRTISAIHYPLQNQEQKWFLHYSEYYTCYPTLTMEGRLDYLANEIPASLMNEEEGELDDEFWISGLFAPTPDLRLDPNWDGYGKNVWKNKEQQLRPFIGLPGLVRLAIQESQDD
jgi:hypothetical protein